MLSVRDRSMLAPAVPAIIVGAGCALVLLAVMAVANLLQHLLWNTLPPLFGATSDTWWWILGMLTLTGFVVGLVVKFVPGHAGPDPATVSLFGTPMNLRVLPGLTLALVLMLAGGVSLGPENPIVAIVVGLTVAIGSRVAPRAPQDGWMILAMAGIIGAMFGTPVAAALLLSEILGGGKDQAPIWDRMFGPLLAAGAGSITMVLFEAPNFSLGVEAYSDPKVLDLLTGTLVVLASCLVGMIGVWLFPYMHRFFTSLRHPLLALTLGGFLLGLLGVLGGPITLFKGLAEMKTLVGAAGTHPPATLALIVGIKLAAIVIAGTCGFPGGRIFPMVFVGAAFGLLVNALFPIVPLPLALACALMGFTLVATRDGWLSLFLAAVMVPGGAILPALCLLLLPAWLVMAGREEMIIKPATVPPAGADKAVAGQKP